MTGDESICLKLKPLADPRGALGMRVPPGPNSFIFMQFLAKKLQDNRLTRPLWKLALPSEKSCIYHL